MIEYRKIRIQFDIRHLIAKNHEDTRKLHAGNYISFSKCPSKNIRNDISNWILKSSACNIFASNLYFVTSLPHWYNNMKWNIVLKLIYLDLIKFLRIAVLLFLSKTVIRCQILILFQNVWLLAKYNFAIHYWILQ